MTSIATAAPLPPPAPLPASIPAPIPAARSDDAAPAPRRRRVWPAIVALFVVMAVPIAAGVVRVVSLARGGPITEANARFFAMPAPVVLHVVAVTLFTLAGAFQFVPRLRTWSFHRRVGRVLITCGFVASLTGLSMSVAYRPIPHDNDLVLAFRLVFGALIAASVVWSFVAIKRGDVVAHKAWITRAYAIGLGAGTQFLDHLPWVALGTMPSDLTRSFLMGGAWIFNLAVAEWLLRRR